MCFLASPHTVLVSSQSMIKLQLDCYLIKDSNCNRWHISCHYYQTIPCAIARQHCVFQYSLMLLLHRCSTYIHAVHCYFTQSAPRRHTWTSSITSTMNETCLRQDDDSLLFAWWSHLAVIQGSKLNTARANHRWLAIKSTIIACWVPCQWMELRIYHIRREGWMVQLCFHWSIEVHCELPHRCFGWDPGLRVVWFIMGQFVKSCSLHILPLTSSRRPLLSSKHFSLGHCPCRLLGRCHK
jgi:hypothetical protein